MTGAERTNFADKRLLPMQRWKDTFFDYILDELREATSRVCASRRGVFGIATLDGDGANKMKVAGLPVELLDGEGHILELTATDAEGIAFENASGVTYYVAARHCLIPKRFIRNPRTGLIDYDVLVDRVGLSGTPDSVVESSGHLTICVDSIFESMVSHAGRLVTVWLPYPIAQLESIGIERDLVVTWDGSRNIVTTSGLLGQPAGGASTTVTDYQVAATGITVRRWTDLRTVSPYAFLATCVGTGGTLVPTDFDTSDQIDIQSGIYPTLDIGYDAGPGDVTPGAGRLVHVNGGALELDANGLSGDGHRTALRVDRLHSTEASGVAIETIAREGDGVALAGLTPYTSGGNLLIEENVTLSGTKRLAFTRTPDLVAANVKVETDLVMITESAHDGLYLIETVVDEEHLDVRLLDGTAPPSWGTETGKASLLRPQLFAAGPQFAASAPGTTASALKGVTIAGRPLVLLPMGVSQTLQLMNEVLTPRTWAEGNGILTGRAGNVVPDLASASESLTLRSEGDVDSNQFGGVPHLLLRAGTSSRQAVVLEANGRLTRGQGFEDDFFYRSTTDFLTAAPEPYYASSVGTGIIQPIQAGNGILKLETGAVVSNEVLLRTELFLEGRPSVANQRIVAKYALISDLTARLDKIWVVNSVNFAIGFVRDVGYGTIWRAFVADSTSTVYADLPGSSPSVGAFQLLYAVIVSNERVRFWVTGMSAAVTIVPPTSLDSPTAPYSLRANLLTQGAAARTAHLDFWEYRGNKAVSGAA